MPNRPDYHLFVGVDVAAASFTASWAGCRTEPVKPVTFPQTPAGFTTFQQQLAETGVTPTATLVVLEATGSYWVALAVALHQAGYVVSVVHPNHVTKYAKTLPRRAKTDACDAPLLLQFASERRPVAWTPPPQVYHELRQRLVARDVLLEMRQQARKQRHALVPWPVQVAAVKAHLDAVITDLDARIATLEHEIEAVLAESAWAESCTVQKRYPMQQKYLCCLSIVVMNNAAQHIPPAY